MGHLGWTERPPLNDDTVSTELKYDKRMMNP